MPESAFTLYPAIDLLDGSCVRLYKGDYKARTEYSRDPAAVAWRWLDAGASWLHVVDLDGARSGTPANVAAVRSIVEAAGRCGARVQVGGGIRSFESIAAWLAAGVARCVIGTAAQNVTWMAEAVERFGAEALVVGLDGRGGRLAVRGWLEQTEQPLADLAAELANVGVRHALVTDVDRDGTLEGPNVELARSIQERGLAAIVSGGVRTLRDVLTVRDAGLAGVVAGRSLYDGTLRLDEALQALGGATADVD